jgi:hypothetical protein
MVTQDTYRLQRISSDHGILNAIAFATMIAQYPAKGVLLGLKMVRCALGVRMKGVDLDELGGGHNLEWKTEVRPHGKEGRAGCFARAVSLKLQGHRAEWSSTELS